MPNHTPHYRRSIRLAGYDYTQPGMYFITICANRRGTMFGRINGGQVALNAIGNLVHTTWLSLPEHHPHVQLDAWMVMPDHVPGIIVFNDAAHDEVSNTDGGRGAARCAPTTIDATPLPPAHPTIDAAPLPPAHPTIDATPLPPAHPTIDAAPLPTTTRRVVAASLAAVVRAFKSASTRLINIDRNTPGHSVWQRNYYEHIVRNEADLARIRAYIADNPARS